MNKNNAKNTEVKEIEVPFEFCDPTLCTLIKEPYILPETNTIVDKNIIIKQLLYKEEHPMTRNKLTVEILEEYNKKSDVISLVNEFKTKLDKWKADNNYS